MQNTARPYQTHKGIDIDSLCPAIDSSAPRRALVDEPGGDPGRRNRSHAASQGHADASLISCSMTRDEVVAAQTGLKSGWRQDVMKKWPLVAKTSSTCSFGRQVATAKVSVT